MVAMTMGSLPSMYTAAVKAQRRMPVTTATSRVTQGLPVRRPMLPAMMAVRIMAAPLEKSKRPFLSCIQIARATQMLWHALRITKRTRSKPRKINLPLT